MTVQPSLLAQARPLFETPPPAVEPAEAESMAQAIYGISGHAKLLSGERDSNYLLRRDGAEAVVLKFINAVESTAEADMQAEALEHLTAHAQEIAVPHAIRTKAGAHVFTASVGSGETVRGRCYSFLPGEPALGFGVDDRMRRSVGRTAALVAQALAGFEHPAVKRLNLWDLCNVCDLDGLLEWQTEDDLRQMIQSFMEHFRSQVLPRLPELRYQAIHNDLSRSNMVVDPQDPGVISGVLDFGDMVYAPLLSELAVASSYQIVGDDPLRALHVVVAGFTEVTPLQPLEYQFLLDFVLARLVIRLLISQWRAAQFPGNSDYILRSNAEARALMRQLFPLWESAAGRDWQAFFSDSFGG